MTRKTVFLLLLFTGLIPFACCPERQTGPYKAELANVIPYKSDYMRPSSNQTDSPAVRPDEVYQGDTLLLNLSFYSLLAQHTTSFSLHASAIALSCDNYPDFTYLKDKIISVEVISDQPFHEIPIGESLVGKISVYNYRDRQIISLPQAILNMNTLNFYEGMEMGLGSLVLPGKPAETAIRTFTVRIAYESGREDMATSVPMRW